MITFASENKRVLEERSARYMGVTVSPSQLTFFEPDPHGAVELFLTNVDSLPSAHSVQIHPQRPELGLRVMRRHCKVLLDRADAVTFQVRLP